MLVGVPKEIKNNEYRVGLTPAGVRELTRRGHSVIIEHNAGHSIALDDESYVAAGASIVETAEEVFERAEMVVKVKEPQPGECRMLSEGQILFVPGDGQHLGRAADLPGGERRQGSLGPDLSPEAGGAQGSSRVHSTRSTVQ